MTVMDRREQRIEESKKLERNGRRKQSRGEKGKEQT
jgi:hypothetical protein